MSRDDPQLKIRLPNTLKEAIMLRVKQNKRSINAEIVDCIEKAISFDNKSTSEVSSSLNAFLEHISKKALHFADRELIISSLLADERDLLARLAATSSDKRKKLFKIFISLLDIV